MNGVMNGVAAIGKRAEVVSPRDERELLDVVRTANAEGTPLRIVGGGSWLDAGRPVIAGAGISTARLAGIVDYVPGDLVLTARAGTSLEEIAKATAKHGQWLALDPYGSATGTVGATIATASSGPLSAGFGRARDLILGISAITGDGQHIRIGGRVVKNVAGFDLVRLLTGSWGTLALITEVSVRLHALPQREESFAVHLAAGSIDAELAALRALPLSVMALQLVDAGTAGALTSQPISSPVLLVRVGGNAARVQAQRALLSELGGTTAVDDDVWTRLRELELSRNTNDVPFVFRASMGSAKVAALFTALTASARQSSNDVHIMASPLDGIVRVVGFHTSASMSLIDAARNAGARVIGERLPPADWNRLPSPLNALADGIRNRFDPKRIFNRGMFDAAIVNQSATRHAAPSTSMHT